jgi:tetratricopeptide (TPR) repeat protein
MNPVSIKVYFLLMISMLIVTPNVMARNWKPGQWITDEEMALQPEFCQVREGKRGQAAYDSYLARYGPGFGHIHHYCYALIFISRYRSSYGDNAARKSSFHEAIGNLNYVIDRADPGFHFLSDIYVDKGALLASERQYGPALINLHKAIDLNKENPRAYGEMVNVYIALKQRDKALVYATEGLKYNPSSKLLRRQYLEAGGKEPFPEPYAKTAGHPEGQKAPETASPESHTKPSAASNVSKSASGAEPLAPAQVASTPKTEMQAETRPQDAGKSPEEKSKELGAPGNPWCRFCPERVN